MTLADITLLAILDPCEAIEVDLSSYENIVKWRENLMSQDFYQKCHKNYKDSLDKLMAQT